MNQTQREFIVGTVHPTNRPGAARDQQLDDSLPPGIRHISLTMNFTRGTEDEFAASMPGYEAKVAELAGMEADLIRPGGAPPFMLLGFEGERQIIRGWEKKYGVPMFTSGQNHVLALRTLGIHKFIGASYFPEKLNGVFARYFTEAGFRVLAMEGIQVPFADVPTLPPMQVYDHIKRVFEKHRDAEGIYLLGSAWKTLEIIDQLEQTLGVPVVHPAPARCWETQIRLGFRKPASGYGRLLAEMPEAAPA
ncbi:MAG: hypothetical protein HYY45_13110 [Deltaproteobacteria bacterium]|nr:hypothetical protein [Deltaproteobacteria bacterium]